MLFIRRHVSSPFSGTNITHNMLSKDQLNNYFAVILAPSLGLCTILGKTMLCLMQLVYSGLVQVPFQVRLIHLQMYQILCFSNQQ